MNVKARASICLDVINLGLVIMLLWQLWPTSVPLLPLLQPDSPPGALRAPDAVPLHTIRQLQVVGGVITTEDLVRWLVANPEHLTAERKQLLLELKAKRDALLETEEALLAAEQRLSLHAVSMWEALTPEQQRVLKQGRNIDSVKALEDPYWQGLVEQP